MIAGESGGRVRSVKRGSNATVIVPQPNAPGFGSKEEDV